MSTLRKTAESLKNTLDYAAPELHVLKIEHAIAEYAWAAVLEEREACCAVLASAEPNARAEAVIEKLSAAVGDCPPHVAGLIAEWLEATADELADLQKAIRARGAQEPLTLKPQERVLVEVSIGQEVAMSVPVVIASDKRTISPVLTKLDVKANGEWARFLIDDEGMISVCSSCGNYGFFFGAPGSGGLHAFLLEGGTDVDYFQGKFEHQFHGKLSRRQQVEINGFFKKIWPAFIEALRAEASS